MKGTDDIGDVEHAPLTRMECGVCWTVYDPAEGDPLGRAPPGTPFKSLPGDWRCPTCDALPLQFLRVDDGR
jgi:rubredoxin